MEIKATDKALRVDYRLAGKTYGAPQAGAPEDSPTSTTFPFESTDVQPGQTFALPEGAEFVRAIPYEPTAAGNDTSMAG